MTGIKNVSITTVLLEIIWTFNKFDLVYTMTKGGPSNATQTIPVYTYITAFNFFKLNKAARGRCDRASGRGHLCGSVHHL